MASGRYGLVGGANTVENWNLTDTKASDSYVASNTAGGTMRGGGVRSWNGSFAGRGSIPAVMPNDEFTFAGYTTPSDGVEGSNGIVYQGQAICSQISITWNWQANQMFSWTAEFQGGNSLGVGLDIGDGVYVPDDTIPPVESACQNQFLYEATDITPTNTIPAMVSATLSITAALSTESNSSTFGGSPSECWTRSLPGPIDWTLAIPQEDWQRDDPSNPTLGSIIRLDLFTNATDFYELRFGRVLDYSGLTVDRSGATIARTLNIAMCAADAAGVGSITLPGGAEPWWGTSKGQ